jgi:ATP-dependent Clp protease, protease subunit
MSVDGVLRVPYNLPGSSQWRWINIYTRLSQERIIFLNQPLSQGLANSIISALLYLDSEEHKPIYLYINSYGDPVAAGTANETAGIMTIASTLAIYDTIQNIKSEVATICMGQAIGMAAFILSCGSKGKRVSLPNAMIALSHPLSATQGQASDILVNAGEILNKRKLFFDILAERTGQPVEKLNQDMDRTFYLSPQAAQDYGLIDRVLTSPKELAFAPVSSVS